MCSFVLLYLGMHTFWHVRPTESGAAWCDTAAAVRARLVEHVDSVRRELRAPSAGEDSCARTLEASVEFEDGASVYALRRGTHEIHVAFDATAPAAVRDGLCAAVLERVTQHVQKTYFAPVKK